MKRKITRIRRSVFGIGPLLLVLLLLCNSERSMAIGIPPVITSISPTSGIPLSGTITITGLGFNDTASRNVVFFGGAMGNVTSATPTSLTVVVPVGSIYSNISVLNLTTKLVAYSSEYFTPTFDATPYLPFSRGFRPRADLAVIGTYHPNALTYQAAVGDIDGDGRADIVVSSYDSFIFARSPIEIYRNIGTDGVVAFAAPVICTASYGARNVKLADLDGDGKLDIVVSSSGSGRISCIRNMSTPGSVTMAPNLNLALTTGAFETAVADFDGDGRLDIAAVCYATSNIQIFRNIITAIPSAAFTSSGTFTNYHVNFATGTNPVSIAAADLDGDTKVDLAVINNTSNSVSILKNLSITDTFMFAPAVEIPVGDNLQQILIANVNADNKPDLIISSFNTGSVIVMQNIALPATLTAASFGTPVSYNLGAGGNGISLGDLDADGKMDIVVSKYLSDSFSVLRNTSSALLIDGTTFALDSTYFIGTGYGPLGITIADIDGDTKSDIITANNNNSTISIFESYEVPDASAISGSDSICVNASESYTATHAPGAVGFWSVTNGHATIVGGTGAADTMATVTGVSAGFDTIVYRVVYLSDTSIQTKVVEIKALADTGAITGPSQVCINSDIQLFNTTADAGVWSSSDTMVAMVNAATGVVTGREAGSAVIMYTVQTVSCGSGTASHIVDVLSSPDAGTISGPGGTCVGSSITLTASVAGGTWFNKYPLVASDAPAGINDVVSGVNVGADTLYYIVSTPTCGSDTAYKGIGIIDAGTSLAIVGDTAVCLGGTTTLANPATGGLFISDNPLVASVDPITGVVTGNSVGTTNISYTVAYGCGPVTSSIVMHVGPLPVVDPIANQTVCNGSLVTVPLFSSAIGSTFSWTNNNTSIGLAANGTTNPIVFTATDTAIGGTTATITVRATANGCTSNPRNFTITVNPTATLTSTLTPASICDSTLFTYTSTADRPGTTFTWHRAAVAGIANPAANGTGNISEYLDNTTADSILVVYVDTLHYNGCITTANITVAVKADPTLSTFAVTSICDSSTFAYTPSSATGGTTYAWSRAAVAGISNPPITSAGAINEILNNTTANPVTVTYVYTLTAAGCSNTQNISVEVEPTPVLSSPAIAGTYCDSAAIVYHPTSATPGVTFTWTRDSVTGITSAAGSGSDSISEYLYNTTSAPITVTYVFTLSINGCSNTDTVMVVINPRAYLTSNLTPPGICSDDFFNYNPTSNITDASVVFTWTRAGVAGISNLPGSGVGNPNEMLFNTSPVFVDVPYIFTTTYLGCGYTQQVTVRVQPKPILQGATSDTVCSGTPFSYTATSPVGGTSFAWTRAAVTGITPGTSSGTSNVINDTLYNNTFGALNAVYVFTLTANSCTYTQNFTLTVNPKVGPSPVISTHSPDALCLNTMFQNFGASNAPADTNIEYNWSTINASIWATGSSSQYALVNFNQPGTAMVILSSSIVRINCITADTFVVNVSTTPAPEPTVRYFNDQFVCTPADMDSYQWGYDDAQYDSTILTGQVNQDYINPSPDASKYYWVITTKGDCMQKTYYKIPTAIVNVNEAEMALKLYPNPANEQVTIEVNSAVSGDIDVQVFNMVGQQVVTTRMVNNKAVFNVGGLAQGSYLVACYRNGVKVAASRFVKN